MIIVETDSNMVPVHDPLLQPVVGLVEGLPKEDLEQITIEAIRTHRRLRDEAEARYGTWKSTSPATQTDVDFARVAYIKAMIDMHAQQAVLSALLDVLGYVPSVPGD